MDVKLIPYPNIPYIPIFIFTRTLVMLWSLLNSRKYVKMGNFIREDGNIQKRLWWTSIHVLLQREIEVK